MVGLRCTQELSLVTRHGRSDLVVLKTGVNVATWEHGEDIETGMVVSLALHWHRLETAK